MQKLYHSRVLQKIFYFSTTTISTKTDGEQDNSQHRFDKLVHTGFRRASVRLPRGKETTQHSAVAARNRQAYIEEQLHAQR